MKSLQAFLADVLQGLDALARGDSKSLCLRITFERVELEHRIQRTGDVPRVDLEAEALGDPLGSSRKPGKRVS